MQRSRRTGPRTTVIETSRGQANALRKKNATPHRRARACPSPCNDRGGQAPALREKTAPHRRPTIAGDRPPHYGNRDIAGDRPPRYGENNGVRYRRARACPSPCCDRGSCSSACSWFTKHACPSPCCDRGGQAPALREKNATPHRRARACPSPCCGLPRHRGGQAPALR